MTGFGVLLRKEILESWRTLRLPVVAGVLLLAGLASPLLARFTPQIIRAVGGDQLAPLSIPTPTVVDAVSQVLKNVGQFGALAAILVAMGSVTGETDRGTAAFVLAKPASRPAFLVAKLVSIGLTLAIGVILAVAGAAVYTAILFEPLSLGGWLELAVALWLSLAAYAAITFLGSTLARSIAGAAAIGVAGLIVLVALSAIPTVAPFLPGGLASLGGDLALGRAAPDITGSIAVSAGIVAAAAILAGIAFRRREL